MNLPQQSSSSPHCDNMTFAYFWQTLCLGWYFMLSGVLGGLALAWGYLSITPNEYESSLLIKVRHEIPLCPGEQAGLSAPRTAAGLVDQLVGHVQLPSFATAALKSLGWNEDARARLFKSSLRVTQRNGFIEIKVRGLTPDDAQLSSEAIRTLFASIYRGSIETVVTRKKLELASTLDEIADSESFLRRLHHLGREIRSGDHQGKLIWLKLTQDEKSRLRALRLKESAIEELLELDLMGWVNAAAPVAVSDRPVYPKTRHAWLLGGIGGFLVGVFLVALRSLAAMKNEGLASGYPRETDL